MISLQAALSQKERTTTTPAMQYSNSGDNLWSRKRKWEGTEEAEEQKQGLTKEFKLWNDVKKETPPTPTISGIDLHLDKPLPLDWQRCLDIQSGKIHFYNTRTHKKTSKDPRESAAALEPPVPQRAAEPASVRRHVCLDLELNLTCEPSPRSHTEEEEEEEEAGEEGDKASTKHVTGVNKNGASDDADDDYREMVTTVCMRCHMLVMMCTSSPSCPNCKFLHPPSQALSSSLFKPGFRLLCCKD